MEIVNNLDVQGHRGCRGLLPENTIPAFKRAMDTGVTTLEFDVVITGDNQVLLSHYPFFNHSITTPPEGIELNESNETAFNIYKMTYDEIKKYDVGLKPYPTFPLQKKIAVHKPLLKEMVEEIEAYKSFREDSIRYTMEIKFKSEWEGTFHPSRETFAKLVVSVIKELGIKDRTTIQCFDPEILRIIKKMDPTLSLSYAVRDLIPFEKLLSQLGFKPEAYSPEYRLVSDALIQYCKKEEIKLIPWTVNEENDIEEMILAGVNGIISDYPDKVLEIYESLKPRDHADH